jgi:hypothetical protein
MLPGPDGGALDSGDSSTPDGDGGTGNSGACGVRDASSIVCCCDGDLSSDPVCGADGGLSCGAGFTLYEGSDCTARNGPCMLPGPPDGGSVPTSDAF